MNLNPLKKDDNTDALVQALQDANNVGTTDTPVVQDAADMTTATDDVSAIVDTQIPEDALVSEDAAVATDTATGISFGGNDLPAGLSSDADAHLPTTSLGDSGDLEGVKKSAVVAHALYNLAANNKKEVEENAPENLAGIASRMRKDDIAVAEQLAMEMKKPDNLLNALDQFVKSSHA